MSCHLARPSWPPRLRLHPSRGRPPLASIQSEAGELGRLVASPIMAPGHHSADDSGRSQNLPRNAPLIQTRPTLLSSIWGASGSHGCSAANEEHVYSARPPADTWNSRLSGAEKILKDMLSGHPHPTSAV